MNNQEKIRQAFASLTPGRDLLPNTEQETKPVFTWKRAAAFVLSAALLLSLVTAFAAGNSKVNALLYEIWPWAAQALKPVDLSCIDQGIEMKVVSASLDGQDALVLVTMQDLEGGRLDETADLFDSAVLQLPFDGAGTCPLLGYDPETGTATFALQMHFDGVPNPDGKVTFSVSRLLTGKKTVMAGITPLLGDLRETEGIAVPGTVRGMSGSFTAGLHGDGTEQSDQTKVLDTSGNDGLELANGVYFMGAGIIGGQLHVQIKYENIHHTDNHGFLWLTDKTGQECGSVEGITGISWFQDKSGDSWEEYIFPVSDMEGLVLTGEFVIADPCIEGDWSVTFPLSVIAAGEE